MRDPDQCPHITNRAQPDNLRTCGYIAGIVGFNVTFPRAVCEECVKHVPVDNPTTRRWTKWAYLNRADCGDAPHFHHSDVLSAEQAVGWAKQCGATDTELFVALENAVRRGYLGSRRATDIMGRNKIGTATAL